ncbi:MAG: class I SAM-dependent DNA methyltransferase [Chitinophagia bacterium]|nr:class I SAM-dependent DNA methyltransferase [Chitinophagia bacterium]
MLSFSLHSVKDTLAPAYRMEKVKRGEYDIFKQQLSLFIDGLNNNETEEHNKNNIIYLLKSAWYGSRFAINTKNSNDLVIHSDAGSGSPIGVLFEVKSPANKVEMINVEQPNSKALWQLLLYYLRARIDNKENNIRHLIVTNAWQWFLFDATWWDTHVHQNKLLRKQYEDYKQSGNNTSYFFESIAQPFWGSLKIQMPCTQIDFTQYKKWIDTNDTDTLVNIYKILSPVHLLKQPFANDSNSLDTGFFYELLYILGLEEKKEKGKKIITRRQAPQPASLVENIISKLESKNSLSKIANLTEYGTNREEQLWGVAMELCVTWLNRILFIKLLEGQLMGYHPNKPEYMFMNVDFLHTFNDLNQLFFDILAQPVKKRSQLQEKYKHVPYLNSSLFERTALEQQTFEIESIDSNLLLPLLPNTVLKDPLGKRRVGKTFLLPYLLRFLDAYDFSSVSNELIQVENKNLINASVLGLIFEKINGYKDGSFFTPGSVTMYMCSESIRKAIIQKFNTVKGWNCVHFKDLVNKMRDIEMAEANAIVNSLRICDPAVGSGHFLVSALNEIIAIKSELRILTDRQGDWIKDCNIIVANDALP